MVERDGDGRGGLDVIGFDDWDVFMCVVNDGWMY